MARKKRVVVKKNAKSAVLGLLMTAIGVIWLANEAGWISIDLSFIGPVLLIALGLVFIIKRRE
jgi:hypothetical protein